jgi:hypothetical protein
MNDQSFHKSLTEARSELVAFATALDIPLNIVQQPLMTRELRDLSLALALSPTADDAKRAMKRYAPAVAGLLFASRDIDRIASFYSSSGREDEKGGGCPYFYLARYVELQIEEIDRFYREEVDEDGNLRDGPYSKRP